MRHTWDNLGDASAAINSLEDAKTQVAKVLKLGYKNRKHKKADTTELVLIIARHVKRESLHIHTPGRLANSEQKPRVNALSSGMDKLRSGTLASFNKQVYHFVQARKNLAESALVEDILEENTLPANTISLEEATEDEEGME